MLFRSTKNPDLILVEGEAQLSGHAGMLLLKKALDLASNHKVSSIYTGAAFPAPISYKEEPEIYAAVNKKPLLDTIRRFGIKPMESGHISGLNGLILGLAKERGIDAVCLLATMPQYAIGLPNPKASGAIVDTLQKIMNFVVSMEEMYEYIKDMDEKMAVIEENVKNVIAVEKDKGAPQVRENKVPGYITEKIEKLFKEAEKDKSKAIILKRELDRWDLYKLYEDRFLDLFKDNQ